MAKKSTKPKKLTPKQERFCQEYVIDFNATQAAIRAGYSKKTAHATGQENLRKPIISETIAKSKAKLADTAGVTVEQITEEFKKIAFGEVSKNLTYKNKIAALENLGKHIGYYEKDNAQQNVPIKENLTEDQLKSKLKAIHEAGTGIDTQSINGT